MTTPTNPAVAAFVEAVNAGDRNAFHAILTPTATMSDDGVDRPIEEWAEREIFTSSGQMRVTERSNNGLDLLVDYTNSTWGTMRTRWHFVLSSDNRIDRFETGQA